MNNKLKILYIIDGLRPGGKERQLIEIVKNINKTNFECGIVTFNKNQHYSKQAKEHTSFFCELKKRPTRLEPFFSIWKCIHDFKPDIIHTWDSLSSLYVLLPCKILKIPLIDGSIRDAGVDKGFNYHLKRFLLKRADAIIGNSIAGVKAYKAKGIVIYNSINPSRFLDRNENGSFNIIMTANFSKYKDHDTFLKASVILAKDQIVDNIYLLGEGPFKKKYFDWIIQKYPDLIHKFHFAGAVSNIEEFIAKCHIGVLCSTSEFSEGLSNSVLEYMAAGLVSIVTDVGGSAEIIENGKNGYLIKLKDYNKIVELVIQLKNNQELRNNLVSESRNTIKAKFLMEKNLDILYSNYKACIK